MQEEWRSIPGYEELYEVSNTGKVRSVSRAIRVKRMSRSQSVEDYFAKRSSKELKPYMVSQAGRVKFHLHRRIAPGTGSHKQSDEYFYADQLVELAFGEGGERE